jgi:hypothetical protein
MEGYTLNVADIRYDGKGILVDQATTTSVGTKEHPLTVYVSSDTDWIAFGPSAAGVIVAILVAILTIGVQRNQIKSNISNFRHHWMVELRSAASELIQLMTLLANSVTMNQGYKKTPEYFENCSKASQLRAKIDLLLSRDDETSKKIMSAGLETLKKVSSASYQDDKDKILSYVSAYKHLLRAELERAWGHTQEDLGINKRFMFLRMFKRNGST